MNKLKRNCTIFWLVSVLLTTAVFITGPIANSGFATERQSKDILRKGNAVIVSKQFAEEVKRNNDLILSHIVVKSRFDKDGHLEGIELVQIDRGSAIEKIGFMTRDIVVAINGVLPHGWDAQRTTIEQSDQLDVTILRQGKQKILRLEIK
jgi:type II secretory pathway component PulC